MTNAKIEVLPRQLPRARAVITRKATLRNSNQTADRVGGIANTFRLRIRNTLQARWPPTLPRRTSNDSGSRTSPGCRMFKPNAPAAYHFCSDGIRASVYPVKSTFGPGRSHAKFAMVCPIELWTYQKPREIDRFWRSSDFCRESRRSRRGKQTLLLAPLIWRMPTQQQTPIKRMVRVSQRRLFQWRLCDHAHPNFCGLFQYDLCASRC